MSESSIAPLRTWLAAPMAREVTEVIERLRHAPDMQQVAVMPDVHLAVDVCIGVVAATSTLIYPQAVGGDIGCGMLAVALDVDAAAVLDPKIAGQVLAGLSRAAPSHRRNRGTALPQPDDLMDGSLSHPGLESLRRKEGVLEFATLGSGNHFIELQEDDEGRLRMMVHSGSRALGPAIRDFHLAHARPVGKRLRALDAMSDEGRAYLHDAAWARRFAEASRRAMAEQVGRVLSETIGAKVCWQTLISTDHNHVSRERHNGVDLWVHRKGAMRAREGEMGVLPGSMGSLARVARSAGQKLERR